MSPESCQNILVFDLFLCAQANTANNFAHITQVEGIVRFQWCWLQLFLNLLVNLQCCCNYFTFKASNVRSEIANAEVPFKQGAEYCFHWVFIKCCKCDDIEMTLESWSNEWFTAAGRSHGTDDKCILHDTERMLFVLIVIPTALSHKLSENFNGWLCTELFFLGHVKIINEDNTFHSKTRSENTSPDLIKFHVNNVLNLVAMSLGWETDFNSHILITRKWV